MSDDTSTDLAVPRRLAVLPLRDVVVYPHMVVPLFVGRKPSILALENAMAVGKEILLVAQRKPEVDEPQARDIYRVGTLATVLQMMKMPDNTVKVMVQGVLRARLNSLKSGKFFSAEFTTISEEAAEKDKPDEVEALRRSLLSQFESYVKLHKNVPPEALAGVSGLDDTGRLADTIAAHMQLALEKKQVVLETGDPSKRMEYLVGLMGSEIDMLKIERKIRGRVKTQMEKSQREYYLNEQMKAIQKELGELDEAPDEITSLEKGITEAGMTKEAQEKAMTELGKLKMMAPMSAEATVVRNYLDWLLKVPWKKQRRTNGDLARAERILEEDHYGLEKIKERILEYLAVQKRVRSLKGPILCLVGPPGVGKTSPAG
ncbi:MAG: LON peptidase substrate-binding domain-containing protein, partial [Gammaproteobacteria bacterium]|nr:LON peptidase substrate-binding domain-containing protein [Gammaproteobacteria bacterium]